MLRVVQSYVDAWQEHFWGVWRWPEQRLLTGLIADTFRIDLAAERAQQEWRRAARLPEVKGRFVRREWRDRIANLKSLDDIQKQRLAASLRGRAMMEVEEIPPPGPTVGSIESLVKIIQLPEGMDGRFREEFQEAYLKAMAAGSQDGALQLSLSKDWLVKDPRAIAEMESYAGFYSDRLTKMVSLENQVTVRKAIITGLDEGMGAADMGREIQSSFSDLKGWQAERIARTESVRARVEGRRGTYMAAGVQMLDWILSHSPCEICKARARKQHPVGSPDLPPSPHPNCDCDTAPSTGDLDRMRAQALAGTGPIEPMVPELAPRYGQGAG